MYSINILNRGTLARCIAICFAAQKRRTAGSEETRPRSIAKGQSNFFFQSLRKNNRKEMLACSVSFFYLRVESRLVIVFSLFFSFPVEGNVNILISRVDDAPTSFREDENASTLIIPIVSSCTLSIVFSGPRPQLPRIRLAVGRLVV